MNRRESANKIKDIDLDNCTERQKMVINMLRQGIKYAEIAERIGCSRQNVYQIVESAKTQSIQCINIISLRPIIQIRKSAKA